MLEAHVVKARPAFTVDVYLRVNRGERRALFGASGAGKSTILSCIAGLEAPDSGEIRFGALKLFPPSTPLHTRPLAYLTQQDRLFPHLSVAENVCFGVSERDGAIPWIDELRGRLALDAIWDHSVRRISGGQARRVALARMLARRPPLVLLDEPFTALDRPTITELIATILQWHRELRFTLVAVDHRLEILEKLCKSVSVIEAGRVVQQGDWPTLRAQPATPRLAQLFSGD
jgi:molybdate transport system ATP-binding protein